MWSLLFLATTAYGQLTCPRHTCSNSTSDNCLTVLPTELQGAACRTGTICPDFTFGTNTTVACVSEDQYVQKNKPMCTVKSSGGKPCGLSAPCGPNLYCRMPSHTCEIAHRLGQECSALNECGYKAVCNQGLCIRRFSVESGHPAQSRVACVSGRVFNGTCLAVSKSVGALPMKCSQDADCKGTDGTLATCECGASGSGQAYCSLHPSDDLVLEYLDAVHNREVELIPRLQFEVLHYPLLQDAAPCFVEHVVELEKFEILKEREVRCMSSGLWLGLVAGVYGLLL